MKGNQVIPKQLPEKLAGAVSFFSGFTDVVSMIDVDQVDEGICLVGSSATFHRKEQRYQSVRNEKLSVLIREIEASNPRCMVLLTDKPGEELAGYVTGISQPGLTLEANWQDGDYAEGYRAAAAAYFGAVELRPRSMIIPCSLNLLGVSGGYYNGENDINELKRMLQLAGYQVLACPGAGSASQEVANMAQAEMNLVVHPELGLDLAKQLQAGYGIPYLSLPCLPYGIEGSLEWLRSIGQVMWMSEKSYQTVRKEADAVWRVLRRQVKRREKDWGKLYFPHGLMSAPGLVAGEIARASRTEWCDIGSLTVLQQTGKAKVWKTAGEPSLAFSETRLIGHIDRMENGLLLASGYESILARQRGVRPACCQIIARPSLAEASVNHPFMGLRGAGYWVKTLWQQYMDSKDARSLTGKKKQYIV